jgi:hypothetical protein
MVQVPLIDFPFSRYIPKGMREPWQRQGTLNRRYNKYAPKLQVPLKVGGLVTTKKPGLRIRIDLMRIRIQQFV